MFIIHPVIPENRSLNLVWLLANEANKARLKMLITFLSSHNKLVIQCLYFQFRSVVSKPVSSAPRMCFFCGAAELGTFCSVSFVFPSSRLCDTNLRTRQRGALPFTSGRTLPPVFTLRLRGVMKFGPFQVHSCFSE